MIVKTISIIGAGFIGQNLIEGFLNKGYNIRILDRGDCPEEFEGRVKWFKGNFDSLELVTEVLNEVEVVFHLISDKIIFNKKKYNVSNTLINQTIQFLNICKENKVHRIIFISSSSVYGLQNNFPIYESALPKPISVYGIHKITLEYFMILYKYHYGLDCKIMRLSNPYGKRQNINLKQGFIAIILRNILSGIPVNIYGDGQIIRDYIYISDVVQASILFSETDTDETVFNIGSGIGHTLSEVIDKIGKILNYDILINKHKKNMNDIPTSILDISKAKNILGYNPTVTLDDGLRLMLRINGLIS